MAPMCCFISLNTLLIFHRAKLNRLFCRKRKVGGDQRESQAFVIYENDFRGPIEKLVKFHVRLLSKLNEHEENIAQ